MAVHSKTMRLVRSVEGTQLSVETEAVKDCIDTLRQYLGALGCSIMWRQRYVKIACALLDQRDQLGQWSAAPHTIIVLLQGQVWISNRPGAGRVAYPCDPLNVTSIARQSA